MPSFDIVSKIDVQSLDNAINTAIKELATRFDFRDSKSEIELDKKSLTVKLTTENDMRLGHMEDIIRKKLISQKIDPMALDFSKPHYSSGMMIKKEMKAVQGIDKENCKKIVKLIKDSNLKVQAAIMDDLIRVTGKKIDDLQSVIALMRKSELEIPLQYINMKS
jgi:uncharacterized protein YajQ (UPF0234 family)